MRASTVPRRRAGLRLRRSAPQCAGRPCSCVHCLCVSSLELPCSTTRTSASTVQLEQLAGVTLAPQRRALSAMAAVTSLSDCVRKRWFAVRPPLTAADRELRRASARELRHGRREDPRRSLGGRREAARRREAWRDRARSGGEVVRRRGRSPAAPRPPHGGDRGSAVAGRGEGGGASSAWRGGRRDGGAHGRRRRRPGGSGLGRERERERERAPSQRATSALAAHMDAYGPAVNDLKSLGTQKCTFGVHGPKQNRSTSLRTPVHFTLRGMDPCIDFKSLYIYIHEEGVPRRDTNE